MIVFQESEKREEARQELHVTLATAFVTISLLMALSGLVLT